MTILNSLLDENVRKRKWVAVIATLVVVIPLILWIINGAGEYGIALFVLIPLFIGMFSSFILGYKREITKRQAWNISFLSLILLTVGLVLFAIEGLICIIMAAPFALALIYVGSLLGYNLCKSSNGQSLSAVTLLFLIIPLTAFTEHTFQKPIVKPVTTKVIINAPVETVWENVIAFPKLNTPNELIFKAGISYPIQSRIEGKGKGAIRYCTFNTGEFVEPITEWKENKLLQFDVIEQPVPMKEISFWDLDSPHLHDYFVSKKGQFKLTELTDGSIELEGTTWYFHNIKPDIYWRLWSNYIIHAIHKRVLNHIKHVSEQK